MKRRTLGTCCSKRYATSYATLPAISLLAVLVISMESGRVANLIFPRFCLFYFILLFFVIALFFLFSISPYLSLYITSLGSLPNRYWSCHTEYPQRRRSCVQLLLALHRRFHGSHVVSDAAADAAQDLHISVHFTEPGEIHVRPGFVQKHYR